MNNIIFTIDAVLPIFLIIIGGYILKKTKLMSEKFVNNASRLVFLIFLPALIFRKISQTDIDKLQNIHRTVLFGLIAVTVCFILLILIATVFIKDRPKRGAFIQGCFRSNYALIGIPLATNLFPNEGAAKISIMLAFILPFFIIYSIIVLTVYSEESVENKPGILTIVLKIFKNPYIIAVFAGIIFAVFKLNVPSFIGRTMDYAAGIATPLALLTIGAFLNAANIKNNFSLAFKGALVKTIVLPLIFLPIIIAMGFKGADLGVLFILFSSPSAISSFIMAKGMKCSPDLAANIVILSTAISSVSIFTGVLILKSIGVM